VIVFLQFLGFPPKVVGIFVDMLDGELSYLSEFGVLAVVTKKRIRHVDGDKIKRPEVSEEVDEDEGRKKEIWPGKELGRVDSRWRVERT
jgi:hypothetical protein